MSHTSQIGIFQGFFLTQSNPVRKNNIQNLKPKIVICQWKSISDKPVSSLYHPSNISDNLFGKHYFTTNDKDRGLVNLITIPMQNRQNIPQSFQPGCK